MTNRAAQREFSGVAQLSITKKLLDKRCLIFFRGTLLIVILKTTARSDDFFTITIASRGSTCKTVFLTLTDVWSFISQNP